MMTYTSAGSAVDLEITAAVNVPASVEDHETRRTPNDLQFHNAWYQRVDLEGRITVSNFQASAVRIEVERLLPGTADSASEDGVITRPGWHQGGQSPGWLEWWHGYRWPWWWLHLNPVSRIRWTREIPAGGRIELVCQWHYFWG
jgi:hypothetical protein